MTTLAHEIDMEPDTKRAYTIPIVNVLEVTDESGEPVAGVDVSVTFDGDGSLDGGPVWLKSKVERTSNDGHVQIEWWEAPHYVPRRPLHTTITISTPGNERLCLLPGLEFFPADTR